MSDATRATKNNQDAPLSHQQADELRIIVFQRVYSWLAEAAGIGELGIPMCRNDQFLDRYSAETLRGLVWDRLGNEFGIGASWRGLPRSSYKEAKDFLEGISLETIQKEEEGKSGAAVSREDRPSVKGLAGRYRQSVKAHKRRNQEIFMLAPNSLREVAA